MNSDETRIGELVMHMVTSGDEDYFGVCDLKGTPEENLRTLQELVARFVQGSNVALDVPVFPSETSTPGQIKC